MSEYCEDFVSKDPHPKYRCKKGRTCAPSQCVMCANLYDEERTETENRYLY